MDTIKLKNYIALLIERGATSNELARRCGVSDSSFSQFRNGKYGANEAGIAEKIASGLNYYENAYNVVDTVTSYQQVKACLITARKMSKWICISSRSGSGKTQSLLDLYNVNADNAIYYLKCRKWTARKFLRRLCVALGENIPRYTDNDEMLDIVITHFNRQADRKPLLILDDAGKLANSAMQLLIPLYDDTLHRLGVVVAGTETLERSIKRNIGRVEGYDEIDGRFGRNYIQLLGATKKDVIAICLSNGITDKDTAVEIWGRLNKVRKCPVPGGREVWFCDDLRELSAMIDDEIIRKSLQKEAA